MDRSGGRAVRENTSDRIEGARLAFALALFTIQRLGDVIRMGRQHIRNGELMVRQGKTGVPLTLPILPELQQRGNAFT